MTHLRRDRLCPLCDGIRLEPFHQDRVREYLRCGECGLVFVLPESFLSVEDEKAYYDLHQNDPADVAYRRFLSRLSVPLIQRLSPGASGLDFGSGPGPTLAQMLTESGFPTRNYDPIYAPDHQVWNHSYDFVAASEVVEHLQSPRAELERIWQILKPGGWLGIMTKRVWDLQAFTTWHYKNDPTHVIFFSEQTFVWLARHWSATLEIVGPDVVLLQKSSSSAPAPREQELKTS
ncbi:class I SAM-dependent methyltransferase [Tautonia marina]|uniref:class I SAM-dependent methyltransferase n=1 Tax=Tautonia marina TaxID=2653855 RepID=UPI001260D6ED|nr:class I SAM-dependent methyltransferase [Tautonia marina]